MRFTDIDVNFDVKYEGQQNCPKIISMDILRVFSDHHMWRQNWSQYVWTSLCQFIFFCEPPPKSRCLIFWHLTKRCQICAPLLMNVPCHPCLASRSMHYYAQFQKDPCRTRMHPCTHLDILDISQNLFATARLMVSSNAMKKIQIAWH